MHHSATSFNMFTPYRMNPIELGFAGILSGIVAAPVGGSVETFATTMILLQVIRNIQLLWLHVNLPWDFGWFGRWVLVSPMYHRVHHLKDPRFHDANYSQFLVLWDRLFGTYVDHRVVTDWELGIEDKVFSRSYPLALCYSTGNMIWHFVKGLIDFPRSVATIAVAALVNLRGAIARKASIL
jgi:sterol desaturase/sphingolipid hydroxylase (fatty acid hydroxylase superfamily)